MKDPPRSAKLKPVGIKLARNRGIALCLNGTVVCHQNTVEDGITAERNFLAGSDNIEQDCRTTRQSTMKEQGTGPRDPGR